MLTPIPQGSAFDFGAAAQAPASQRETSTAPVAPAKQPAGGEPVDDTVKLSPGAQVRLLKTQGQTVPEIAITTGLSHEAVNSYLGISPPLVKIAANKV